MPWKDGYTISDEVGLRDDAVHWPNEARLCVHITVDLSVASGPAGLTAADLTTPRAVFGAGDGLTQLRRVLDASGLRATIAAPAVLGRVDPATLRSLAADGHEIAAHGWKHEDVSALPREEEQQRIERATTLLAEATGERPSGWFSLPRQSDPFAGGTISPNTMTLLREAGYAYFGNGLADDIPHYWVTDFDAQAAMLALPYYYHYDDQFFLLFPGKGTGLEHADSLARNWRAEFAAQYRRGRYFHMVLHPYAIGFAHRIQLLATFLQHMTAHPGLWNATGRQIARHWQATCPPETHLKLEPSVWRDYPGSIS
jgi:peptidoglycan/xylan/chitin deacetylase (PgdA/CDA1 family)